MGSWNWGADNRNKCLQCLETFKYHNLSWGERNSHWHPVGRSQDTVKHPYSAQENLPKFINLKNTNRAINEKPWSNRYKQHLSC